MSLTSVGLVGALVGVRVGAGVGASVGVRVRRGRLYMYFL